MTGDFFGGFAAFLVAYDEDFVGADSAESGDDGGVVAEVSVAVEFTEVSAYQVDIVSGLGSVGVSGDADGVPGGEVLVEFGEEIFAILVEGIEFGLEMFFVFAGFEGANLVV